MDFDLLANLSEVVVGYCINLIKNISIVIHYLRCDVSQASVFTASYIGKPNRTV